jgi:hypothetical protein
MADLLHAIDYEHGEILTSTLNQVEILLFLPFLFFTPLNIFLIYDVFCNKVLQDLSFCLSFPNNNHICSFMFFHIS